MAIATVALSAAALGCGSETVDSVEARLSEHEFLTSLMPDDATPIADIYCHPATAVNNADCTLIYATGLNLAEIQKHYRDIYNGRGWQLLADNGDFSPFIWQMEWRDEAYKVVVEIRQPEEWPGTPGPEGTKLVVNATVVERK